MKFGNIRDDLFEDKESLQNIKDEIENKTPQIISKNDQIKNLREKYTDSLDYIKGYDSVEHNTKNVEDSELIVLGSGNLGLIYLTQWKHRLTYCNAIPRFDTWPCKTFWNRIYFSQFYQQWRNGNWPGWNLLFG